MPRRGMIATEQFTALVTASDRNINNAFDDALRLRPNAAFDHATVNPFAAVSALC
jgi:hypothetical protein